MYFDPNVLNGRMSENAKFRVCILILVRMSSLTLALLPRGSGLYPGA
jgi:hypothetical protein